MPPNNEESSDQKQKRACVTLCTKRDGSDRLLPYFTGNGNPPQSLSKNLTTRDGVWRTNNVAWISVDPMREWLLRFFSSYWRSTCASTYGRFLGSQSCCLPFKSPGQYTYRIPSAERNRHFPATIAKHHS